MAESPEFLIEDILPANEVHLLGGSSGSGKTTFLFQTLAEWQEGRPVLGHTSHPVPYVYVSIDRSRTSVNRTLARIGLEGRIANMICREDLPGGTISLAAIIQLVQSKYPTTRALFIEGFQTLVGDKGNSYTPVAALLSATTTYCAEQKLTIVGVCHSPKMKLDEGFQHHREVILGSVAWAAFSDTVITMDQQEKTGVVTVRVLPRNAPMEEHPFIFSAPHGILVPPPNAPKSLLVRLLISKPADTPISRQEVLEMGAGLGISLRTTERTLAELVEEGQILSTGIPGAYRRATFSIH